MPYYSIVAFYVKASHMCQYCICMLNDPEQLLNCCNSAKKLCTFLMWTILPRWMRLHPLPIANTYGAKRT